MASPNAKSDPSTKQNGMTNGDQLETLRKMFPIKNGLRLRATGEKANRSVRAATLFVYLESRGHFELHETVFGKRAANNSAWWSNYFSKKVLRGTGSNKDYPAKRLGVLNGAIIPGVNKKTRQIWDLSAVIGYVLHDNVNAIYTALHTRRNKTKR